MKTATVTKGRLSGTDKVRETMMQMILTAIAEGNLRMGTETMEHNSELKSAMNRVCRLGEELSNTLNDSEKELLEKLEDSYAEATQSDSQQSFINGFRLGALVIMEVFAGRDGLVLGNVEG